MVMEIHVMKTENLRTSWIIADAEILDHRLNFIICYEVLLWCRLNYSGKNYSGIPTTYDTGFTILLESEFTSNYPN